MNKHWIHAHIEKQILYQPGEQGIPGACIRFKANWLNEGLTWLLGKDQNTSLIPEQLGCKSLLNADPGSGSVLGHADIEAGGSGPRALASVLLLTLARRAGEAEDYIQCIRTAWTAGRNPRLGLKQDLRAVLGMDHV